MASSTTIQSSAEVIGIRRDDVMASYNSAKATNLRMFAEGDVKATSEYIFPNQMEDANQIVDALCNRGKRVISIQKKTKVGADGLMIEIAKLLTTYIDDSVVVNPKNVRILTGMSNISWEKDMVNKAPTCFKSSIFHHGQLGKADLGNIANGLIIIDEVDTGDKEYQVLHETLKRSGILDVRHMETHNNKFVFISATMVKELYDLYRWGDIHELYRMTIPATYIGHTELLERGLIKEFYSLNSEENANKWVYEDIIKNYGLDYRVHIVRVTAKNAGVVHNACIRNDVEFRNHTSSERILEDDLKILFEGVFTKHIVLGVKGFFRRANLIPNQWKLRIGATHENCTKKVDNSVQIQGLPGRMTGYWGDYIKNGHKTGPHRTSIAAIEEYNMMYDDPFGSDSSYHTAGFKKVKTHVTISVTTMFSPQHIGHLVPVDLPKPAEKIQREYDKDIKGYKLFRYGDLLDEALTVMCSRLGLPAYNCVNNPSLNMPISTFTKKYGVVDRPQRCLPVDVDNFNTSALNKLITADIAKYNKKCKDEAREHNKPEPEQIVFKCVSRGWVENRVKWNREHQHYCTPETKSRSIEENLLLLDSKHGTQTERAGGKDGRRRIDTFYDEQDQLMLCIIINTGVMPKKLPPKSVDHIRDNPHKVTGDTVRYSALKEEYKTKLPQEPYYWKTIDGWLWLNRTPSAPRAKKPIQLTKSVIDNQL